MIRFADTQKEIPPRFDWMDDIKFAAWRAYQTGRVVEIVEIDLAETEQFVSKLETTWQTA